MPKFMSSVLCHPSSLPLYVLFPFLSLYLAQTDPIAILLTQLPDYWMTGTHHHSWQLFIALFFIIRVL